MSEVFSYYYQVTATSDVPGSETITLGSAVASTITVSDTADGTNNSNTVIGDNVRAEGSPFFGDYELVGLSNGTPVLNFGGNSILVTNDPNLANSTVPIVVTSGTEYLYCFAGGTHIATPAGSSVVEDLQIGDHVVTSDGRCVPVKWIGRQTISTRFTPAKRLLPVCIAAGALGGGLPLRDLTVTADHALLIDGLLVNAGALVNGTTITHVPLSEFGESFTVYHIETENHDVILAEGTPAETYIDYVARRAFDNYAEYVALYGEDRTIAELPYPRISAQRLLPPALKTRLGLDWVA